MERFRAPRTPDGRNTAPRPSFSPRHPMLNPRGPVFMTPPRLSPPLRFNAPFPRSPGRAQLASHWFPRPGSPYPGLVGASQAQNFNSTLSSVPEEGGLLLSPGAASLPPPQRQMRNSLPVALLANGGGGGGAAGVQPGQDGRRFSWSHQDFYSPRPGQQQQQNNTLHGNRDLIQSSGVWNGNGRGQYGTVHQGSQNPWYSTPSGSRHGPLLSSSFLQNGPMGSQPSLLQRFMLSPNLSPIPSVSMVQAGDASRIIGGGQACQVEVDTGNGGKGYVPFPRELWDMIPRETAARLGMTNGEETVADVWRRHHLSQLGNQPYMCGNEGSGQNGTGSSSVPTRPVQEVVGPQRQGGGPAEGRDPGHQEGAASNRSNVAAYNTRNIAHGPDCRCPGRPGQAHGDTRDESDEPDAFFDMPRVCEFYDSDGRRHERVAVPSYLPPGALPPFPPFDNAPNSGDANNAPPRQQAARGCHHPPRRHYRGRGWRGGRGSYRGSCQNSPGINQQQNPQPRGGYQGRGGQRQQPQNQGVQELQQALNELSLQDGEAQQANGQQGGDAGDQPGDMPSLE